MCILSIDTPRGAIISPSTPCYVTRYRIYRYRNPHRSVCTYYSNYSESMVIYFKRSDLTVILITITQYNNNSE